MAVRDQRPVEDLGRLIAHPRHLGGSDGIFVGAHPHPRARGTFASYLATYVREHGFLDWPGAVQHLSAGTVARFHLGRRGRVAPGFVADLLLMDPETVQDRATYVEPLLLADGIDDVIVAGVPVLAGGELTGARTGRGLRADPGTSLALRDLDPSSSDGGALSAPSVRQTLGSADTSHQSPIRGERR